MAEEIHITKPLAVGNDSIAKGFLSFLFIFSDLSILEEGEEWFSD